MTWMESLLRVAVAFLGLLICSRILGKKLVSHMTFFDFIAGVVYGAIGGNLIFNRMVPLWLGFADLSVFTAFVLLTDFVSLKSIRGRRLIEGKQLVLIQNGRIRHDILKGVRLTIHDLLMLLRKKNIFYPDEVETAVLETDGSVTVLQKPGKLPASRGDLNIDKPVRGLPMAVIVEGRILEDVLADTGQSLQWLQDKLRSRAIAVEDVLLGLTDGKGELVIDRHDKKG